MKTEIRILEYHTFTYHLAYMSHFMCKETKAKWSKLTCSGKNLAPTILRLVFFCWASTVKNDKDQES